MITDLVVALFVAILVVAGLQVPSWGDAIGRLLRRGRGPAAEDAPRDRRDP